MVSRDGRSWQRLAQIGLIDFTTSPSQSSLVLGTGEEGLVRSDDGGKTFAAVAGAPRLAFIDWSAGGLYGLDVTAVVWTSTDEGTTWETRSDVGGQPGALIVTEAGHLYAATGEGVMTSTDGGHTFTTVVGYDTASHSWARRRTAAVTRPCTTQ